MSDVAQAQAQTIQAPMTWAEIEDRVKGIGRDAGKEAAAEAVVESIKQFQLEQKKKSESEKARGFMAALRKDAGAGASQGRVKGLELIPGFESADELTGTGIKAAAALPLLFKHNGDVAKAVQTAKAHGQEWLVSALESGPSKALEAGNLIDAGTFVPQEISMDVIGYLYNTSVVRALGARIVPMGAGNLTVPKLNTSSSFYWVGETRRVTVSQQEFGSVKLSAKKGGIAIPISNDALRYATGAFSQIILDDIGRSTRVAEDQAFIRSDGSEYKPRGIRSLMAAGNQVAANASNAFADIVEDLFKLQYLVDGKTSEQEAIQPGWIMNKRDAYFLKSLISSDGTFIFLPQMMQGRLLDVPYGATNNIPRNLGGGGDESELYYGDFAQLMIGQSMNMTVEDFRGAAFIDASGSPVYGAQQDITLKVLTMELDSQLRHASSFGMLTGVDWSAGFDA